MDIEIVDYNKVKFRNQILEVSPEVIQDAYHGIVMTGEEFTKYITVIYNKQLNQIRIKKLKDLGI